MPDDLLRLEIGNVATGGSCVARHEGRVVFVRHTLPGEVVLARVDDDCRGEAGAHKRFWRADAVQVLEASPDRVPVRCPVAGPGGCGGCDWQHATLAAQRRGKADVVREQFRRLAGIDLPDLVVEPADPAAELAEDSGADDGLGWRTRVRFAVDAEGRAGLHAARSHRVIPLESCPITHPAVLGSGVLAKRWPGVESIDVACGTQGPAIVVPDPDAPPPGGDGHRQGVRGGDVKRSSRGANAVAASRTGRPSRGRTWVEHRVLMPGPGSGVERRFRVSRGGFWQVHPRAGQVLLDAMAEATQPAPGERAVDLYAGAGLFAAALGLAVGGDGSVIAVEGDPRACADARRNLHDLPQVRIEEVRIGKDGGRNGGKDAGRRLAVLGSRADVVVLDPPRAGAGRELMERVLDLRPRIVAYLACDPASLARDVAYAAQNGYRLASVRAFDLFPMTHHVECLATLRPSDIS